MFKTGECQQQKHTQHGWWVVKTTKEMLHSEHLDFNDKRQGETLTCSAS